MTTATTTLTVSPSRTPARRSGPGTAIVHLASNTVTGASRRTPPRHVLNATLGPCDSGPLPSPGHAGLTGTLPGAREIDTGQHPNHPPHEFPCRPVVLLPDASFGQSLGAADQGLDDVAIAQDLDGHHVGMTPAEEATLLRQWLAADRNDAVVGLGVLRRTARRRWRQDAKPGRCQPAATVRISRQSP